MKTLRIATRQSPLALWQAEHVARLLESKGCQTELVPLVSRGDTDMRPIDGTRQVGMFTKRIQQALVDDEADVAVHSLKDLPTEADERFVLAAVPERETTDDALVSERGWSLDALPSEATIGTGSKRRAAQLLSVRPDLNVQPIRGNVQTRLDKLHAAEFDAIILAEAGLLRLQMHDLPRAALPKKVMLPAPGQGALGIEVRSDDQDAHDAVAQLNDLPSRAAVVAERAVLAALHGGCLAPIAALGQSRDGELSLDAVVLSPDGSERLDQSARMSIDDDNAMETAAQLANQVAEQLLHDGAEGLINQAR